MASSVETSGRPLFACYYLTVPFADDITELCRTHPLTDLVVSPGQPVHWMRGRRMQVAPYVLPTPAELLTLFGLEEWPKDQNLAAVIGGSRFRANFFFAAGTPRAVLRLLPDTIKTPEEYRVPQKIIEAGVGAPDGLLLVCGATGSGKSTTMAALLNSRLAKTDDHIVTIEAPVEYQLRGRYPLQVHQRDVGTDVPSFATGVKSALRENPAVIMIGEINDPETAVNALDAALTGHLVIGTIHAAKTSVAIESLLKHIPDTRRPHACSMLPTIFRGVVCQRLLDAEMGRVAIHEVMMPSDAVSARIRQSEALKLEAELQTGGRTGHQTFAQSVELAKAANLLTPKEAAAYRTIFERQ